MVPQCPAYEGSYPNLFAVGTPAKLRRVPVYFETSDLLRLQIHKFLAFRGVSAAKRCEKCHNVTDGQTSHPAKRATKFHLI